MHEELEYLYSLERFGIQPGLAVMEELMDVLGHPEKQFVSIHVTGTNGKGSTCAILESVLRTAGFRTALYTSPHLYEFNERMQINRVPIPFTNLITLIREVRALVEVHHIQPTFFEFTTALAFLYFSRSNIDIAIIEVGMGGTWDATNVITPVVSVITNIGLDHMAFLGNTKPEIAQEKAGIIKEGAPIITREESPDLLKIFSDVADKKNTHLIRAQDVVTTQVIHSDFDHQRISVRTSASDTFLVSLPLLGVHQVKNMEVAIAALIQIRELGMHISERHIIEGVESTVWEGRLQIVSKHPLIIVDGAHNIDGAEALTLFLESISSYDILLFAMKKGKIISPAMESIISRFERVIITKGEYMPEDPHVLAERIRGIGKQIEIVEDVRDAVTRALAQLRPKGTLLITGSLYMVPQALAFLKEIKV